MGRKSKNISIENTESKLEAVTILDTAVETSKENEIIIEDQEVVETIEEITVEVSTVKMDKEFKKEIEEYVEKFNVLEPDAIKLAQKLLRIRVSGEWDELTASAYAEVHNKRDFINDYKNYRRKKEKNV